MEACEKTLQHELANRHGVGAAGALGSLQLSAVLGLQHLSAGDKRAQRSTMSSDVVMAAQPFSGPCLHYYFLHAIFC